MPRPAGNSRIVLVVLLILPFIHIAAILTAASQVPAPADASHAAVGGIWVLNRDIGDLPGAPTTAPEGSDGRQSRGRGGSVRMGGGGGRGFGRGGGDDVEPERRLAISNYVRTSMEASRQLTIVVHDTSVTVTDADGRVVMLATNDKKVDERAENGLVKISRKNHWDGDTLVSEIAVDNGPRIERSYELSPGKTQLTVTTSVDGSGRPTKLTRVYERPVESK